MSRMANGILRYTSRDYNSILSDLIDAIPSLTDLWTSRSDSDTGIVLVKLMSALGDMISYNFDKQALEYYAPTVTQRKNASKLFDLIGYHMHWYKSAITTISLMYNPELPDYVMYSQVASQCFDGDTLINESQLVNVYYDYRMNYGQDAKQYGDISIIETISVPPITDITDEGEILDIPLPSKLLEQFDGVDTRPNTSLSIIINGEPDINSTPEEDVKSNALFRQNAVLFGEICIRVYDSWIKSNPVGLHTYLNDPMRSLEVFSQDSSSVMYSIVPTTEHGIPVNGQYPPTIELYPYVETKVSALQGYLCSTTFTANQLKDNRFYVPDSQLDEDHMYVSYTTVDNTTNLQKTVFLTKTDNLLTVIEPKKNGEQIIYFQFGVDDFDYPYIELSSYWRNILPEDGITFTFYYFRTSGSYGNITRNYLTRINSSYGYTIQVTGNTDNNEYLVDSDGRTISSPGFDPQTASDAYKDSINYIMTYNTLVTIYDFTRYTRRQDGISNALSIDRQRSDDLNDILKKNCESYTEQQLRDILGPNVQYIPGITPDNAVEKMSYCLYNIRRVMADYKECPVTVSQAGSSSQPEPEYKKYGLEIYPIVGNFKTLNSENISIASIKNYLDNGKEFPYMLYKINTSDDGLPAEEYSVETQLSNSYEDCRIVNVLPTFTACRVFNWRCCGVLHLTKAVSESDAKSIIRNVVEHLSETYTSSNVEFGKKLTYMEIIDTILDSDPRIRYFDAGLGDKKLIAFEDIVTDSDHLDVKYFNTEAYFNDESIMRFVQTVGELETKTSPYYGYLTVDPSYIYSGVTV